MEEGEALPDHQRCRRNDGRQWRCVRRVMDNKKYCELHYLQARHRHYKQKVPDSMKLQRKSGSKRTGKEDSELQNLEIRAKKPKKLAKILKKRRSVGVSEALDKALKKMKLKKGDLQLELIRMFLQRQMERKKKRSSEKITEGDLMRDLPNGLMAISQAPLQHCGNAGFFCERKLGLNSGSFMRRCFRSKNIEPFHISSLQIFPYRRNVANLRRGGKKNCHRCQRSNARSFVQCSSCRMEFFCIDCINEWYSDIREEVKMACPVCRGTCNCKTCLTNQSKDGGYKELLGDQNKVNKIPHLHYLVCLLLPVLKQINQDQRIELEIQAKLEGKAPSDIHIQQAECSYYEQLCCDNCKTSIVDVHRSCSNCSYDLCLLCSWEIHRGTLPGGTGAAVLEYSDKRKTYVHGDKPLAERHQIGSLGRNPVSAFLAPSATLPDWKGYYCNGCISCPPKELGGCGDGILDLRCIFPLNWTKELEISAEEIVCSYDFPENLDVSSHCSSCTGMHDKAGNRTLREAATRENSEDNYLYCPTVLDIQDENLEHFQKHWIKGQPVIVRNVLQDTSDFSWDPVVMFCTSLKRSSIKPENGKNAANAADCLDWSEVSFSIESYAFCFTWQVEIGTHQFFKGYLEGQMHPSLWPEILRFKDRPSPNLFQEQFPAHNAEFIRALPFQEYMNPNSGLLNLAVKLPKAFLKPDLGPHVYISHGVAEELEWGDSVTKLYYESSDVVGLVLCAVSFVL
ncbi:hypothetical protein HHK36_003791 [Tetracentron sinense]|uniref:Lysine-specific demethylase JMJ25 n=1 Tax=Tetracentron sinense TaxID=13715 RepID=A0A835DSG5_TETSI|nr:hypothetical protein HHK36_003791 [Tetracentron sinense]